MGWKMSNTRRKSDLWRRPIAPLMAAILLLAPAAAVPATPAHPLMAAQDPAQAPEAAPALEDTGIEELHLMVGRSLVINTPLRVKRVAITDPNIADALIVTPNQILVNGKAAGAVSFILWNEFDQNQTFDLYVDLDILEITRKIRQVFPEEAIQVEASKDVVMLTGQASSSEVADKVIEVVTAIAPKVISLMEVPTPPTKGEILLEVKFAEVDQTALTEYGFNFFSLRGQDIIGVTQTQQFAPIQTTGAEVDEQGNISTGFEFSDLLNIFLFSTDLNVGTLIKALKQKNLLQILAQPNLLTETGKEASFLAGGEFPFPIVQGGANAGAITVSFKEFGVRLTFTPTITVDGNIHLKVEPEVSTLDFANAVTIQGSFVPAISTRRVQTQMELKDGQTFAIAGLIDDRLSEVASKVPILGDIPILGKLFRSRSTRKTKTELVVFVTPWILDRDNPRPLPTGPLFPKDFLDPAKPEKEKSDTEATPTGDGAGQ